MANLGVSKKVNLVDSWSRNDLPDDFLSLVADLARTKKGDKMKVKVNEQGMKLTRTKFLTEKTAFFPLNTVQAVEQREEFPQCVVCILSDPNMKYKIIALRCETDADAVHLTSVFADILSKVKSENVQLKKMENGNWTLRGRTDHNANRHLLEVFNEHKQANGDVAVKADDDIRHMPLVEETEVHRLPAVDEREIHYMPVLDAKEVYKNNNHNHTDVYIKNGRADIIHDNDDDFIIETEVVTHPNVAAEIHADHEGNDVREATRRLEHVSMVDRVDGNHLYAHGKHLKHTETIGLPSKPVVYTPEPSGVVSSRGRNYSGSSSIAVPSEHRVYSAQRSAPSQPVIYKATSSRAAPSQPLVYSSSARSYEPTFSTTSAGYYTNPWAQRRVSRDSSVMPMRAHGSQTLVKFDQQSIMSNTSRLSRSSRLGRSELSIPNTIQRSIEHVYPQPVVILRRAHGYTPGYTPAYRAHGYTPAYRVRPASYHARPSDLRVYYEDDHENGMLL
ncbi:hypothetical protein BsWGS_07678 [Bradybaena similaris]